MNALRTAFDKMVLDPEFKDEITKAGFDLSPATGKEVQSAVAQATNLDDRMIKIIQSAIASGK